MEGSAKLKKVIKFIDEIDGFVGPVLLLIMFVDVVLGVITRLLPGNPLSFSVELGEMLLSFVIWFSLSRGVKENLHIRFDLVIKLFPPKLRKFFFIFGNVLFIVFLVLLANFTMEILQQYLKYDSKSTIMRISMFWVRLPIFIGCIATSLRLVHRIYLIYTNQLDETGLATSLEV